MNRTHRKLIKKKNKIKRKHRKHIKKIKTKRIELTKNSYKKSKQNE
jgi:hypothetical protein